MMEQTFGKSPYKNLRDKSRSQSRGAMHDVHRNPYIQHIERQRSKYNNEHTCAGRSTNSQRSRKNSYN